MAIRHLSLSNFRNYARLELSLPAAPVVLHGRNAQGKTSLLEALFYLITAHSPYTRHDRQLIHWRMEQEPLPYARVAAEFDGQQGARQRLEATLLLESQADGRRRLRRQLKLNGVEKRVVDVVGLLQVVLFLPQDLTLVEGAPAERRRFLDTALAQVDADYLRARQAFERLLPQRNALLRRLAETRGDPQQLSFWDERLAETGARLIFARQRLLRELESAAARAHADLSGGEEVLQFRYLPGFAPEQRAGEMDAPALPGLDLSSEPTVEEIAALYAEQLREERASSILRGVTLSGPHRDELRFLINGRDGGDFGSRGQARSIVLALKLAELAWLRERCGRPPLLLLDEVVAELDARRRSYLLARLMGEDEGPPERPQTLMTTAELAVFDERFLARARVWEVRGGMVDEGAAAASDAGMQGDPQQR